MTICTVSRALDRIKLACKESPLIVTTARRGYVDVFFRNTVYGEDIVRLNPPNLVGVFHGDMNMMFVRNKVERTNDSRG